MIQIAWRVAKDSFSSSHDDVHGLFV
jgi:putative hydrolase of the HAD superfamily